MLCPIMSVWLSICAVKSKQPALFQIFFYVRQASGAVVPKPGGGLEGNIPPII